MAKRNYVERIEQLAEELSRSYAHSEQARDYLEGVGLSSQAIGMPWKRIQTQMKSVADIGKMCDPARQLDVLNQLERGYHTAEQARRSELKVSTTRKDYGEPINELVEFLEQAVAEGRDLPNDTVLVKVVKRRLVTILPKSLPPNHNDYPNSSGARNTSVNSGVAY